MCVLFRNSEKSYIDSLRSNVPLCDLCRSSHHPHHTAPHGLAHSLRGPPQSHPYIPPNTPRTCHDTRRTVLCTTSRTPHFPRDRHSPSRSILHSISRFPADTLRSPPSVPRCASPNIVRPYLLPWVPSFVPHCSTRVIRAMPFNTEDLSTWTTLWMSVWTFLRVSEASLRHTVIDLLRLRVGFSAPEGLFSHFDRFCYYINDIFTVCPYHDWQHPDNSRVFEILLIVLAVRVFINFVVAVVVRLGIGIFHLIRGYQRRISPTLEEALSDVRDRARE